MGKVIRKTAFIFSLIAVLVIAIISFSLCLSNWPSLNSQGELNLPHNNYNIYNFTTGAFRSYNDNLYTSCLGLDISEHDKVTSFKSVKEQGIEFIYIRVGYRGTTSGGLYKDAKFEEYYKAAKENGFKIGVYFFSQAINEEEATEEANFILDNIKDKEIDLPIAYDFEFPEYEGTRSEGLSSDILTNDMVTFSNIMEENGYETIVYTNRKMILTQVYNLDELFEHKVWLAQYYNRPECSYPFEIWQYSEHALIEGITNECDINIMLIKKEES